MLIGNAFCFVYHRCCYLDFLALVFKFYYEIRLRCLLTSRQTCFIDGYRIASGVIRMILGMVCSSIASTNSGFKTAVTYIMCLCFQCIFDGRLFLIRDQEGLTIESACSNSDCELSLYLLASVMDASIPQKKKSPLGAFLSKRNRMSQFCQRIVIEDLLIDAFC